jgi:hypothetical protein
MLQGRVSAGLGYGKNFRGAPSFDWWEVMKWQEEVILGLMSRHSASL